MRWVFLCSLLLSTALHANMRAPWVVNRLPSFPLRPLAGEPAGGLEVLAESLAFSCDSPHQGTGTADLLIPMHCDVTAEYEVVSDRTQSLSFSFILAADSPVTVAINSNPGNVRSRPFDVDASLRRIYRLEGDCRFCDGRVDLITKRLYEASFEGQINTGKNRIRIEYRQPLSSYEKSYGYFRTSTWAHALSYELWPLKEWKLAPDFHINLSVSAPQISLMRRILGESVKLGCTGANLRFDEYPFAVGRKHYRDTGFDEYQKDPATSTGMPAFTNAQSGGRERIHSTFGASFPDRLICSLEYQ